MSKPIPAEGIPRLSPEKRVARFERRPRLGRAGRNGHAAYETVKALSESYFPFYYSDRTLDPKDLTLVGYSDGFDLTAKFGVDWMAAAYRLEQLLTERKA